MWTGLVQRYITISTGETTAEPATESTVLTKAFCCSCSCRGCENVGERGVGTVGLVGEGMVGGRIFFFLGGGAQQHLNILQKYTYSLLL